MSVGDPRGGPSVCPHCWMVNPGAFRLCSRCGASMDTLLQESAGLRRTAPIQSPVPVGVRLSPAQRALVTFFVAVLALSYLAHLLPVPATAQGGSRPVAESPRS